MLRFNRTAGKVWRFGPWPTATADGPWATWAFDLGLWRIYWQSAVQRELTEQHARAFAAAAAKFTEQSRAPGAR